MLDIGQRAAVDERENRVDERGAALLRQARVLEQHRGFGAHFLRRDGKLGIALARRPLGDERLAAGRLHGQLCAPAIGIRGVVLRRRDGRRLAPRARRAARAPARRTSRASPRRRSERRCHAVLQRELGLVLRCRRGVVAERRARLGRSRCESRRWRRRSTRPCSSSAASIAGCVCRHDGQGLIDVSRSCHGASGAASTRSGCASGQAATKKPFAPSRICAGPVKPRAASSAASTPASAARPACRCLLIAPSSRNCHKPADCVPALPSAQTVGSSRRSSSVAAAMAEPYGPQVRRVVPNLVVRAADGVADAAHGFVAREHGFQEVAAVAAVLRGDGPGGRDDDAARDG